MTDQLKALLEEMEENEEYYSARSENDYYYGKLVECQFVIEKLKQILNETPTAPLNGE